MNGWNIAIWLEISYECYDREVAGKLGIAKREVRIWWWATERSNTVCEERHWLKTELN